MSFQQRRPGPYRVCVFCSANSNIKPEFFRAAAQFSQGLAQRGWELVYGGAQVGLMGQFANEMLKAGGVARGAITEGLAAEREIPHDGLSELLVVKDLFDRKKWFMEEGDAFVIFPGGFGTLDEALEVITWKMLKYFDKPIVFANFSDFWKGQLEAFAGFASDGMIRPGGLDIFQVCNDLETLWKVLDGSSQSTA